MRDASFKLFVRRLDLLLLLYFVIFTPQALKARSILFAQHNTLLLLLLLL